MELYKKAETARIILKMKDLKKLVRNMEGSFADLTEQNEYAKEIENIKQWINEQDTSK